MINLLDHAFRDAIFTKKELTLFFKKFEDKQDLDPKYYIGGKPPDPHRFSSGIISQSEIRGVLRDTLCKAKSSLDKIESEPFKEAEPDQTGDCSPGERTKPLLVLIY
jgi:hypothetical protein